MKITLIEANQDLGVSVDGANLGPNVLSSYFKDNLEVLVVNKDDVIKEKDKDNLKKNLNSVNSFNKDLYNTLFLFGNFSSFTISSFSFSDSCF